MWLALMGLTAAALLAPAAMAYEPTCSSFTDEAKPVRIAEIRAPLDKDTGSDCFDLAVPHFVDIIFAECARGAAFEDAWLKGIEVALSKCGVE